MLGLGPGESPSIRLWAPELMFPTLQFGCVMLQRLIPVPSASHARRDLRLRIRYANTGILRYYMGKKPLFHV